MTKDIMQCTSQETFDCDKYENCEECPGYPYIGPNTWPVKENLQILLALSNRDKIVAFNEIVKRFVAAKDIRDMELWIARVLEFYIKKNLPKEENVD